MILQIIIAYAVFLAIRYLSILAAFSSGLGVGGEWSEYSSVLIFLPGLILQVLYLANRMYKKYDGIKLDSPEFIGIAIVMVLFALSALNIIPNNILLPK